MSLEPSKSWWPMSRSTSAKDLRQQYADREKPKSSGKFNSFASAIGLKSKKSSHPALTIQDPPLPMQNVPPIFPASPSSAKTRPTSSSTRSRVDSLEPRTPADSHRPRRQSLLTLSDTDPFAGRPIVVAAVPSDPNRLSAYSNSSVSDLAQRKGEAPVFNRVSYASSSSNSNSHAVEFPPATPPISPQLPPQFRQVQHKLGSSSLLAARSDHSYRRSKGSIGLKRPDVLSRQTSLKPSSSTAMVPGSSSSIGPGIRASQPEMVPPRPKLRARGMTDVGSSQRVGFFVEQPLQPRKQPPPQLTIVPVLPSPRVIVRQPSASRIQTPPACAPPTQRLPSPPISDSVQSPFGMYDSPVAEQHVEFSSSRISFSSAISLTNDMFATPFDDGHNIRPSDRSLFSHYAFDESGNSQSTSRTVPSSPRTLKKSTSIHSLSASSYHASPPPTSPPDLPNNKPSRKHKNFYPRLPIPPLPSAIRPTTSPTHFPEFGSNDHDHAIAEQRRGSTASSVRKRLFSSASRDRDRPSTNQPMSPKEDDTFSLFSLRSDNESHLSPHKPWLGNGVTKQSNSTASYWDEGVNESTPVSPLRTHVPQSIMSKAELAKLEETMVSSNNHSNNPPMRSRGLSVLSASTMASELDVHIPIGLSPPPRPTSKPGPIRLSSTSLKAKSLPPPIMTGKNQSPSRPLLFRNDDDNDSLIIPLSTTVAEFPVRSHSPPLAMQGLPPPPRPRRARLVSEPEPPKAKAKATPPPPLSVPKKKFSSIRSKVSMESVMHRQSLLRKPSFLDIEDDSDPEADNQGPSSFLDLARESFDTVQTGR